MPFSGGRKPTPRSVRIVSMQDSNAASATTPTGAGSGGRAGVGAGAGGRLESGTDRTTTMRVSSCADAPPPRPSSSSFFRSRVLWSRAVKVSAIGALANLVFFFPDTGCPPACRHRGPAKVPISRLAPRTPARPVLENPPPFLPVSRSRSGARAPSEVPRLQRYSHPDRVSTQLTARIGWTCCVVCCVVFC